ncbi:MAG: ExeA family protein [Pirellulales bacterium]
MADEFGAPLSAERTVRDSVRRLQSFLTDNAQQGRHAVLVVDEAHLIDDVATLEALRLMLNFEVNSQPCLTLLLLGQSPLLSMIGRCQPLEERLSVKCVLRPLTLDETAAYVNHRLAAAGVPHPVFDAAAMLALHEQSRGIPRRINRLCDLALLVGYADEQPAIGSHQIESVSRELTVATAE